MSLRELEEKYAELRYENEGIFELVNYGVYTYDEVYDRIAENEAAMDELRREIKEMEDEKYSESEMKEEEKMEMNMETYARETERNISRKHRKGDIAAKKHLAAIYPISTDSIRRNGNGAYIRKGNTIRYQYEQTASRKFRREEGKRQVREYMPESYVDSTPNYRESLERELAALRLEKSCLNRDREVLINDDYPDYYLIGEVDDEIYAICGRISEIAEVLNNEVGVWSF